MAKVEPIVFRLYPERKALYCRVHVWPTRAAMMAYLRSTRGKKRARELEDCAAMCTGRDCFKVLPGGRMKRSGEFAEINCHRQNLDMEIVAHEVAHAVLAWKRRINLPDTPGDGCDVSPEEERFCYGFGLMVNEFAWGLQRRGVWNRPVTTRDSFDRSDPDFFK